MALVSEIYQDAEIGRERDQLFGYFGNECIIKEGTVI